jgi:uncharacterized RDD family membrane protein YckC
MATQALERKATAMERSGDFRYAGFWIRLWASAIDVILLTLIICPLMLWIYGPEYYESQSVIRGPMDFLISWVFPAIAVVVFWRYKSATPGKMVVGAKIVDAKSLGRPSAVQCIVRYFAYLVSMLPLGLGFLWIAFDRRKQAFHDKLAGTVVIRERSRGSGA